MLIYVYIDVYIANLSVAVSIATLLSSQNTRLVSLTCGVLQRDITGLLLGELCVAMLLLCCHNPSLVLRCDLLTPLMPLLAILDGFNQVRWTRGVHICTAYKLLIYILHTGIITRPCYRN